MSLVSAAVKKLAARRAKKKVKPLNVEWERLWGGFIAAKKAGDKARAEKFDRAMKRFDRKHFPEQYGKGKS